jgi:hypothetical protein
VGGFRRFLNRRPAEGDPLEHFAREEATPHPSRRKAQEIAIDRAVPMRAASVDKESVGLAGGPKETELGRVRREGRRAPSYVWLSQKSREARAHSIADFIETRF